MKIPSSLPLVFVVPSLHGGGAEFVARTWMGWLAARGHKVTVVTTSRSATQLHLPRGVAYRSVGRETGQLAKIRALRAHIDELSPAATVSLQAHANLLLLAAVRSLPESRRPKTLISERNLVSLGLPNADRAHKTKIAIAKKLYPFADHVIAISHPVAAELIAGFGVSGERCTVVPNPATAKVDPTRWVTRTAGTTHGIQIVLPCRLVAQKRPTLAILTAAELNKRGILSKVVSFGGGPLLREMEKEAAKFEVDFTDRGWVEDWFTHFDTNAVVLLPSDREGFGNVLVEAAAVGVPSVAISGALGVADAIVPGITGELALSASAQSVADAVIRASHLPVTGIESWLDRFSVDASGRDLESVIFTTLRN